MPTGLAWSRWDARGRLRLARLRLLGRVDVRGRVRMGRGARIAVRPGSRVVLEDGCEVGEQCRIEAGGPVRIGPRARLEERSVLVALAGIEVGADCVVGAWAMVTDGEPTFSDPERPVRLQPVRAAPIRIGAGARIGVRAAVVAADVPAGAVLAPYETHAPRRSA